jgi:hypothetical protein
MKAPILATMLGLLLACIPLLTAGDEPASREDVLRMINVTGMQKQAQRAQAMIW